MTRGVSIFLNRLTNLLAGSVSANGRNNSKQNE